LFDLVLPANMQQSYHWKQYESSVSVSICYTVV